ncbi:MAG: hypothetical protein IPL65_14090 [Lewinellaceae bacterium]|nr:hypothetical protein [Lewinellaceae bacterium]
MKNQTSILLSFTLLVFVVACQPSSDKNDHKNEKALFDEAAETAAIMNVIEGETKCFFDGNYEGWAKHWSHENYAIQAWNNSDGTADAAVGWEKINSQGKDWIEKYYKNGTNIIHPVVKREKPLVKFFNEKTAYLIWTQYNADKEKTIYRTSQEIRLMEKDEEGWKIVNVSAFWDTQLKIPFDSLKIN